MPLLVNLRHLEEKNLLLKGELAADELELNALDELIRVSQPISYALEVQTMDGSILVQGRLEVRLDCECARCLKPHRHELKLEDWICHLPLEGEEKAAVANDCVDLTPYIREDIVLAFPQHPLCEPECKGLSGHADELKSGGNEAEKTADTWAELNKLKFKK